MGLLDGRAERGQATVELALVLPVIVMALLLVVQVGLVARSQILVVNAAREGARAVAVDGLDASAVAAARASPGLDPNRVQVRVEVGAGGPGALAAVEVRYRAPTDVPLIGAMLGEPELTASVTMRIEQPSS